MAIISPQRNAILSFEKHGEVASGLYYSQTLAYMNGTPASAIGISEGANSRGPRVLVFGKNGAEIDPPKDLKSCFWDFAVLLREPTSDEKLRSGSQVGTTALQTVELLAGTVDSLCLDRTGISETYPVI